MIFGKPVWVAQTENKIQVAASDLGLPAGQFPAKIRMRDDRGVPRWFLLQKFEKGSAIYVSGEFRMTVHDDQKGAV